MYDTFSLLTDQTGKSASQGEMMCIGVVLGHTCISIWGLPEKPSLKNQYVAFIFAWFVLSIYLFIY